MRGGDQFGTEFLFEIFVFNPFPPAELPYVVGGLNPDSGMFEGETK